MKKTIRISFVTVISAYIFFIIGYLLGEWILGNTGLEYRFWVDVLFRIIVWFVPAFLLGVMILLACIKQWKKKSGGRWILLIVLLIYGCAVAYLSFLYVLFGAFTMTSDKKMADGNLVVAVPEGMEYYHHYAEPVGIFFRRNISFDEERLAESLSIIYDADFQVQKADDGEEVYVSESYPGVEVQIIRHGYTESNYLENDFKFALTSQKLEEHRSIFDENDVELVPYVYGSTEENPEGYGTYHAVLITGENQEGAARAIAEFIKTTLQEDLRADGESCWSSVDGSIFLVVRNEETGEYSSIRNIPFGIEPENYWVFDVSVTDEEIFAEITKALN